MFSVGSIAKVADVPIHRVLYVIRTREIQPIGRAGSTRVFDDAARDRIFAELARIDELQHHKSIA